MPIVSSPMVYANHAIINWCRQDESIWISTISIKE
ncbi:hypothetical protein MPF_1593 [Methanohalophilus portucalensis FDF-1]|uniref:Uncharacterized protein n=1 Tax=Methanohalophilus portucalensis FDF-1 TaxID=523843 RepID=A0A1L9C3R1_9EURY|nr:hypothetical protein MPF_1593 [Methanohalophilus portucalensis FDF-1]